MSLVPKRPWVCKADDGTIYDFAVSRQSQTHTHPDMDFVGDREIHGVLHALYRYKRGQAPKPF